MGAPQQYQNELEIKLQTSAGEGLKPWHVATLAAFSVIAYGVSFYPWQSLGVAVLIGGVWIVTARYFRLEWEAKEAQAIATSYACICGPEVIVATHPNESVTELQNRANDFRQKLRDSENPYWQIIPIEVFPYTPVLSAPGFLSTSWNTYKVSALTRQYEANMAWLNGGCPAQLRGTFASQVMKIVEQENQAI